MFVVCNEITFIIVTNITLNIYKKIKFYNLSFLDRIFRINLYL